jgi:glucose 1-dehydrogenase
MDTTRSRRGGALVTGGSRGIGRGIVVGLAQRGYDVCFSYVSSRADAEALKEEVARRHGVLCGCAQAELGARDAPAVLVGWAADLLGHIDVLVNNAGVTVFGSILSMSPEEADQLIDLDLRGYLLTAMHASRHMVDRGIRGNIVHITSSRAERAYPGDAVYGAVKAGVERASKSMALDLAPYGIRVNCVAPGATRVNEDTGFYDQLGPRIPLGRVGSAEDVANAVAWLVSPEAAYVTGVTVRVDGGLILPGMPEDRGDRPDRGWGFGAGT